MKKAQQGFTVTELMVAVSIIGILSVITIPAYEVYISRAQVTEAINLLRGLKNPVEEYYNTTGTMPDIDNMSGIKTSGKYVKEIRHDDNYTYIAVLRGLGSVNAALADMELEFSYDADTGEWSCSGPADKQIYLPSSCKRSRSSAGAL